MTEIKQVKQKSKHRTVFEINKHLCKQRKNDKHTGAHT